MQQGTVSLATSLHPRRDRKAGYTKLPEFEAGAGLSAPVRDLVVGGWPGIRTLGTLSRPSVFKTGALNQTLPATQVV